MNIQHKLVQDHSSPHQLQSLFAQNLGLLNVKTLFLSINTSRLLYNNKLCLQTVAILKFARKVYTYACMQLLFNPSNLQNYRQLICMGSAAITQCFLCEKNRSSWKEWSPNSTSCYEQNRSSMQGWRTSLTKFTILPESRLRMSKNVPFFTIQPGCLIEQFHKNYSYLQQTTCANHDNLWQQIQLINLHQTPNIKPWMKIHRTR